MKLLKGLILSLVVLSAPAWGSSTTKKQIDSIKNSTGGGFIAIPSTGTTFAANSNTLTFTNKSIDGGSNTFTNIPLASVTGAGNVTGQSSSVDGEVALFSGTGGKTIKRATGTGYAKLASGVLSAQSAPIPTADINAARTINAQSGTTYTFVLTDGASQGGHPLVTGTNASAQTYTVPPNSSVAYPIGDQVDVCQLGAGKLTISPGSGVTLNSLGANLSIGGQYVCVSLVKTATNTWIVIGNLIP